MKRYYKEENGKIVWFRNSVNLNGFKIINPTEEQILEAGYVEYVAPAPVEPSEEVLLEIARQRKLREIEAYDKSKSVDNCYIKVQGHEEPILYWADKTERDSLKGAIRDCLSMGITTYRLDLRDLGISIEVECEKLLQLLTALEVYAIKCYNKTTDHIYAVKALKTKEEIGAYDHTQGYPEMLTFEF